MTSYLNSSFSASRPAGTVYLVGAGPGDPELLTLKARRLIGEADAVVHDYLVPAEFLAFARPDAEKVFVGKKGGGFCCPQRDIESVLIRLAREGKTVVRLKGGDPFVFGRGGEEAEALAEAGIAFEIVPGVTSALGAASYAGVPLTHRAHSSAVVFLTGHEDPNKPDSAIRWEDYGRLGATLCVYMGMKNLETITRRLQAGGMAAATPALVVQSATTGAHRQLLSTVGDIALESEHDGFGAPAIVVIGEVAALAPKLAWFAAAKTSLATAETGDGSTSTQLA
jgi:uroporphyrinogen III methyltransferase/synthase